MSEKPRTQEEIRSAQFSRRAREVKALSDLALGEIDAAMIENQINMAGCEVIESLEPRDE